MTLRSLVHFRPDGGVASSRLSAIAHDPSRGAPGGARDHDTGGFIYIGKVFPLREPASAPTYVDERRVEDRGDTRTSTHVTRDPSGAVVLAETAVHDRAYALQSYTLHANQLGQTGGVDVVGDRITFRLNDRGGARTSVEHHAGPVVVGPTLVGYIVENLAQLRMGKTRRIRMAIPE